MRWWDTIRKTDVTGGQSVGTIGVRVAGDEDLAAADPECGFNLIGSAEAGGKGAITLSLAAGTAA